jgi:pimeloyl-ACP methyl ester carboxylesterase
MQRKSVLVDDLHTTYVQVPGKQPPIVWLHGWGDSADTFLPVITSLRTGQAAIALNLPGFGGSQHPKEPWNVSDYAAFTAKFLNKLGITEVCAVVGHSNGGAVAVRLLDSNPAITNHLILISAAGIRSTADQRLHRQAFKVLAKTGRVVTRPLGKRIQGTLKKQLYKKAGSDYLLLPHMQETFKKVVAEDIRDSARALSQKTLLIWGEADEATPVFMGQAYNSLIANSKLVVVPGADHFVHQGKAAEVSAEIDKFLS